ncbi:CDP-diacylglycerol--serine O-phosphatidyltransferase [Shewanella gelidii]|uniref:CDP-diacylglycerol--serine O-phosphatidyltransferase n=1 Tax=Shewanella gelidii TaxID=1642821 RepID=A0A917ND84_9GAMM|nr:CDP-diacylglycerol--serine O-phosphatidyltransferase [Shewanella gelidii]MCL1098125.1 CDP-diacylglycerol--serine O-phosphatidyltransferase [Shewanella gelidii]GGI90693.1 CDP-diacylglycerol--serine O-phosphatidyltransferase [Shewanella gelidii]
MLEKLGGIPICSGDISWLLTPKNFRTELLSRIANAQASILITALYLEDDECGREIMQALVDAKQSNPQLKIEVLVDFHRARRGLIGQKGDSGNYFMYKKVMENTAHPFDILGVPVKSKELMGVLHLKGFIVDDTVIYSGASLNNIYLHHDEKYRFDRYHVVESAQLAHSMRQMVQKYLIEDKACSSLTQSKELEKLPTKADVRRFKKRLSTAKYQFEGVKTGPRITPFVGLGRKKNALNKAVVAMVAESKESLFICTPYFNPPFVLVRALAKHLRKGKQIDIVVGDKTSNDFYIPPEDKFSTIGGLPYLYEQMLRKFVRKHQWAIDKGLLRIHLWKHDRNSFHLKGISADGNRHLLTGSNLNPRAWALDIENGLLLHDVDGIWQSDFEKEQNYILEHSQCLKHYSQIDSLDSYPKVVKKLLNRIRRLKADFLLRRIL